MDYPPNQAAAGAAAGATAGYYGAQMQQNLASDTTIRWDGPGYIKTLDGMLKVGAMAAALLGCICSGVSLNTADWIRPKASTNSTEQLVWFARGFFCFSTFSALFIGSKLPGTSWKRCTAAFWRCCSSSEWFACLPRRFIKVAHPAPRSPLVFSPFLRPGVTASTPSASLRRGDREISAQANPNKPTLRLTQSTVKGPRLQPTNSSQLTRFSRENTIWIENLFMTTKKKYFNTLHLCLSVISTYQDFRSYVCIHIH